MHCTLSCLAGLQVGPRHLSHSELDSREQRQARAGSLLDLFVWPLMTTEAAEGRWPWPAAAEGIIPDNKSNPPPSLPRGPFVTAFLLSFLLCRSNRVLCYQLPLCYLQLCRLKNEMTTASTATMYRAEKKSANLAKQHPGRARQKS